jgi:hypothetical protein
LRADTPSLARSPAEAGARLAAYMKRASRSAMISATTSSPRSALAAGHDHRSAVPRERLSGRATACLHGLLLDLVANESDDVMWQKAAAPSRI